MRDVRGVKLSDGGELRCDYVVMTRAHSARDTFAMLHCSVPHGGSVPCQIAHRLSVLIAYLFAGGERLARVILAFSQRSAAEQERITCKAEKALS